MKIVADESVDFRIVAALRGEGYDVWAVVEEDPSITDKKVLSIAFDQNALLLTEIRTSANWSFDSVCRIAGFCSSGSAVSK